MAEERLESKRWGIAIAAVIMQLSLGTVYAWSVFKKPLMTAHGWGETETQVTFMICIGMIGIAAAFGGRPGGQEGPPLCGDAGRNSVRDRHASGGSGRPTRKHLFCSIWASA